jgi:hypothetical protein
MERTRRYRMFKKELGGRTVIDSENQVCCSWKKIEVKWVNGRLRIWIQVFSFICLLLFYFFYFHFIRFTTINLYLFLYAKFIKHYVNVIFHGITLTKFLLVYNYTNILVLSVLLCMPNFPINATNESLYYWFEILFL